MSLVNDALKRAKAAQDQQTGTPLRGAPLHYAEPPPASRMWLVALVCFVLAVGGAIGGIWYWKTNSHPQWLQTRPEPAPAPAYKIIIGANPDAAPKPKPATAPVAAPPTPMPPPAATAAEPAPKTDSIPGALVVDKRPALNVRPPVVAPGDVVAPAVAAAPVTPPVELKLQGILYSATKPTAILNGRTVAVGDRFGGMTVSSIEPDRITITYSNQPIVLRMP